MCYCGRKGEKRNDITCRFFFRRDACEWRRLEGPDHHRPFRLQPETSTALKAHSSTLAAPTLVRLTHSFGLRGNVRPIWREASLPTAAVRDNVCNEKATKGNNANKFNRYARSNQAVGIIQATRPPPSGHIPRLRREL